MDPELADLLRDAKRQSRAAFDQIKAQLDLDAPTLGRIELATAHLDEAASFLRRAHRKREQQEASA